MVVRPSTRHYDVYLLTQNMNNVFIRRANKLLEDCRTAKTIAEAQQHLTALNLLLKEVSELQSEVGRIRKAARELVGKQRKSSPVGRPEEGSTRTINGKQMIFLNGRFYEVEFASESTKDTKSNEETEE